MKTLLASFVFVSAILGCQPSAPEAPAVIGKAATVRQTQVAPATPKGSNTETFEWRHPQPRRLVGIGDVHGDLDALTTVLTKAGLIDKSWSWAGGDTWLVQTGDLLDRGPKEREVIDLMLRLRDEASAAGGRVIQLSGNHELMNSAGDLRYVTPEGFAGFADIPADGVPGRVPSPMRGRVAAFMPGGPYAVKLARDGIITQVGDTVFVHGGVTPEHVQSGIEDLNLLTQRWLLGQEARVPEKIIVTPTSPVWTRRFSLDTEPEDCQALLKVLDALGAKRMVVGHTVQKRGIATQCDDHVWRIDTGMSAHYGGRPQALEVTEHGARIID